MSGALHSHIDSSTDDFLPFEGNLRVDHNVLARFPPGTTVLSANRFGISSWTVTTPLHLKLPNGEEEKYFLKSAPEGRGRMMIEGEFNALSELYRWAPEFVPKPHSWGRYRHELFRDVLFSWLNTSK